MYPYDLDLLQHHLSQVFDGGIEPRPVCGGMCGMACDSTGCNCSSVIDPRPKFLLCFIFLSILFY